MAETCAFEGCQEPPSKTAPLFWARIVIGPGPQVTVRSFSGPSLKDYSTATMKLLSMAGELEAGRMRTQALENGAWVDISEREAEELRQRAHDLSEIIRNFLALAAST